MPELVRKLRRLSAMGPGELAHRVREKVHSELDRVSGSRPRPSLVIPFKAYLAGAPGERFYGSHRQDLLPFVGEHFPQWIDRAVEEAEQLCRHQVSLLGYGTVDLGPAIDWHRDPVTGRRWERRFWTGYRFGDGCGQDPKIIHELNRHQHLPRLAKAYRWTGDERYAAEAVAQLLSWIDQNPPGRGINWQSSLEIAIRAISWMWTIFLLLPSRSLDEASAQRIGGALFEQLEHVHRYPSVFSSPNTHLIGEAAALFLAGLVFQDQNRPAVWLQHGASLLTEAVESQVLDDGVYGELSACYHCYALDFFLQAMALGEHNRYHFPAAVPIRVRRMLQFLMHLTRPDGTLPALGDDDSGRALALDQRNYRSYRDGLCTGAILFRRGDFQYVSGSFHEETLWMLGLGAWEAYNASPGHKPADTQAFFPSAGYAIQRSGWDPLASHLVFDCGGLGMLTGAHAHADALSITLFRNGHEVLVDAGTYVYNCAPEWRGYFRSTRAHNTVTIDGRDQVEQAGTFCWKTSLLARAGVIEPGYLEGEHDGYLRPLGVVHRRRVVSPASGYWIVVDDFRGTGKHSFDLHFHVAHGMACPAIPAEWMSRSYGRKEPCLAVRASAHGCPPLAVMTFLVPESGHEVRRLELETGAGLGYSYRHDGFEDIAAISLADSEISLRDFRMRGEFFWLRLESGVLKEVLAIRARELIHRGTTVFRRLEPEGYLKLTDIDSKVHSLCVEFAES